MADVQDEDSLEIQKVECFERYSSESAWVQFGEGTVLWQASEDGMQQRLLVMQGENGEWARELEALDFPDPTAQINCQPEYCVITWCRAGKPREFAMAFTSVDGCIQVWEDVQALQDAAMQDDMMGTDMYGMTADELLSSLCGGAEGGGIPPLPEPSEEALPELVLRLTGSPPPILAMLLQQLMGGVASGGDADGGASKGDYIGALAALAGPLRSAAHDTMRGDGSEAASSGETSRETRQLQLATVFKTLLSHAADDTVLLQRLLQQVARRALTRSAAAAHPTHAARPLRAIRRVAPPLFLVTPHHGACARAGRAPGALLSARGRRHTLALADASRQRAARPLRHRPPALSHARPH